MSKKDFLAKKNKHLAKIHKYHPSFFFFFITLQPRVE